MANFIEAIFHLEKRELKKIAKEADRVIALDEQMTALTDDELRAKTDTFKQYLAEATTDEEKDRRLEEIKIEAFAVAREAAWRSLKQNRLKSRSSARWSSMAATLPRCVPVKVRL